MTFNINLSGQFLRAVAKKMCAVGKNNTTERKNQFLQCLPHGGDGGGDDGGDGGSAAMAAARGGVDGRGRTRGRQWRRQGGELMDEAGRGGGEEEKTVALCGAGNLASTRCGEEGSGLCVKHPFSGDTA